MRLSSPLHNIPNAPYDPSAIFYVWSTDLNLIESRDVEVHASMAAHSSYAANLFGGTVGISIHSPSERRESPHGLPTAFLHLLKASGRFQASQLTESSIT